MNEYITLENLKQYDKGLQEHMQKNKRYNFWTDKATATTKVDDIVYFTTDSKQIIKNGEIFGGAEASDNSVKYSDFNKNECSLTLGYDATGKLEIQIVRDLAYDLTLSVSPTYAWYGSNVDAKYTVKANNYTKGAAEWQFSATDVASSTYPALSAGASKVFSHTYSTVTANKTGNLVEGMVTTPVTIQVRKPIICETSAISSGANYTNFSTNAGYIDLLGVTTYNSVTPSVSTLYIGVPGDRESLKYKSGTSDNESPRSELISININGQPLTYSIFVCSVTAKAKFEIYE